MTFVPPPRLQILPFPQQWSGSLLSLRVLVTPFGNPLQPLDVGLEEFARARIALSARLIPSLQRLPHPDDVAAVEPLALDPPVRKEQLYEELASVFNVDPSPASPYVAPTATSFLKFVMQSYRDVAGIGQSRTEYAVTDNRYVCALVDGARPTRPPKPKLPPKWDSIIAMALRQPMLAEQLGLIYEATLALPEPSFFEGGGWLYVTLDGSSDYAAVSSPGFLKVYAARFPRLSAGVPRALFAPVLFPVRTTSTTGSFDEILHEAEQYADGFARLVHTFQSDRMDYVDLSRQDDRRPRLHDEAGLRLGWDDEQVVIWLNRQITDDPRNGFPRARDTPLGVRGFRVDVRDAEVAGKWTSLVRMRGAIAVGGIALGQFDGEMAVELAPSQLQGNRDGEYWLPPYFTLWSGASLIAADTTAFKIANATKAPRVLEPVHDRDVPLKYGKRYQFRVRLTDLTGGGPSPSLSTQPADAVATSRFRRFVPPGPVLVAEPTALDPGSLRYAVSRPLLGYPAVLYTSLPDAEDLLFADVPAATAAGRPPGVPDPDVTRLRIDVDIASLEFDPANLAGPVPRQRLYTCFRDFDADLHKALELVVQFHDAHQLTDVLAPNADGPLRVPTGRTIELTLTAIARRDPGFAAATPDPVTADRVDLRELDRDQPKFVYFGKHAARIGKHRALTMRREPDDEADLFEELPGVPFQGLFVQPDAQHDIRLANVSAAAGTRDEAPGNAMQRLARQLRLVNRDLTLSEQPGTRVVFGAGGTIRHVLSPDHSTITFASITELTSRWVIVIPLLLARDWTWDALTDEGLQIFRSLDGGAPTFIGTISPRRSLNETALRRGVPLDRSMTKVVFFDAIDPKVGAGEFPREIAVTYTVSPQFRSNPAAPRPEWTKGIELPIAARPAQVPRIVSAGLALSPYERDETYSRTAPRRQMLWVEFADPVANPRDAYFARVTVHAADPMLTGLPPTTPPGPLETPIGIDPEPIRSIVAGQPHDAAGLDAMQLLVPADSEGPIRHFLVPLPEGMSESAPELFGFFVYEFAVGHLKGWSTARARFGSPQRVSGVQHPAPALVCSVTRTPAHVSVSAPYANPVLGGQDLRAEPPTTELWGLLYVQVRLADAKDWRNVLVGRTRLQFGKDDFRGRTGHRPQGLGYWDQDHIAVWLEVLSLPQNAPLSVLVVEMLPEPGSPFEDPLGKDLGEVRVLRVSPLTPVPTICLDG